MRGIIISLIFEGLQNDISSLYKFPHIWINHFLYLEFNILYLIVIIFSINGVSIY